MFKGNKDGNIEDRSLLESMWEKVVTKIFLCDGMFVGKDVVKL